MELEKNNEKTLCCLIGGLGFIGQHLIKALSLTQRRLLVIDKTKCSINSNRLIQYIQGDYNDNEFLQKYLLNVDEVILLAHSTTPKTSFDNSMDDLLSNVPAAVRFFEIASRMKLKKIILVSSGGTVYGKALTLPIKEDSPTIPISPYGITKLTIERYAYMYYLLKKLPIVIVRPGNAFGEGQRAFSGQGFIATAMGSILTGRQIQIFGQRGTIRDYIYVEDLVAGIISALDHGVPGESYNLGTGQGRDNIDIIENISQLIKNNEFNIDIKILPERPFDVPSNILDSSKLHRHTGWRSRVRFEDALYNMWEWFLEQRSTIS